MTTRHPHARRQGNVLVMTAFMMIGMMALLAFAIDLGYVYVAKTELQRSADSAAMAAAWDLIADDVVFGNETPTQTDERARETAAEYASYNRILTTSPGLSDDDVTVGYLSDPWDDEEAINPSGSGYNAVRVRVQRTPGQNGAIPMLFGKLMGVDETAVQAEAVAATYANFGGFQASAGDENIMILPFTLDLETWQALLSGVGDDNWCWNPSTGTVTGGSDGIREVNLYPQPNGSAGNRGTLDIGGASNSTDDICQQILEGISPDDFAYHGGSLELDENGEVDLDGDTGISAAVKEELGDITGQPRIIPIFSEVVNPGDNAQYTIVAFVGVRVMKLNLNGGSSSKKVIIQPATIVTRGGIPSSETQFSFYVYSPVWLVR